jgi:serine/threonine protein kinase
MQSKLVEELFASAVATAPEDRRHAIFSSDFPEDVKVAAARLVKAYESSSQLLNDNLISDIAQADPEFFAEHQATDIELNRGDKINEYVVESLIGEGGMSIVYKAIQEQPVKRQVAIKLIRPSILAPRTVLRFFREQQALALIRHPNVTTLYEVGVTKQGIPFAAMEIVNGHPISTFCDKHSLNSRQRIILFLQACAGLKHAHRHGIVHRDIKPENILVGVSDRKPIAKLIDFGIAKIDDRNLPNNSTVTRFGQILGSPRYMSPEQFASKPVDQRSDVYSAALVLFELLSRSTFRNGDTTEEVLRQASFSSPELLSHRIKESDNPIEKQDAKELLKLAKRDLDWVILKALSEDPQDRYASIVEFGNDLRSTLRNQPISIKRPSLLGRSRRFVNTNWKPISMMASSILLICFVLGIIRWRNSEVQLSAAEKAKFASNQQTAVANDLVMRLLASDNNELTTDRFDLSLIPIYQAQHKKIEENGGPQSEEDNTVYGILAVLYAMSGDFDSSDDLMEQVSDGQESDLRHVREKICSEYAENAKRKLALMGDADGAQRAAAQMTLAKCYLVWNMLDDSQQLLTESIEYFDNNDPDGYESLSARVALARVYAQANREREYHRLLVSTYEKFKGKQELLETEPGKHAMSKVVANLRKVDPWFFHSIEKQERKVN